MFDCGSPSTPLTYLPSLEDCEAYFLGVSIYQIVGVILRINIQCCFKEGFNGILHCLEIVTLYFVLQSLGYGIACKTQPCSFYGNMCNSVFYHKDSSLFAFCSKWRGEVCQQLLAMGALLIKIPNLWIQLIILILFQSQKI